MPNRKIKILRSSDLRTGLLPGRKSKVAKVLPEPLVPTKYVAPPPKPKLRTQKSCPPVSMPRSSLYPKPIAENVKKLIDEITPYYRPEAIRKFNQEFRHKKNLIVKVTEKERALKNHVKSFEVSIIS